MSNMDFNTRAKFVYTRLLPLVQEATGGRVEGLSYEVCGTEEEIHAVYADGHIQIIGVDGSSLRQMALDVLEMVS